ncbi:Sodium/hydrogen exchanger family-domain-containing protein [Neohortaea acidophila]|uniref:Sodium/hydrogen exchanger family-domain-containing protein n=1 Tax=Neohortaea acidophila TaxID=245834 RepID=A0A6A6PK65_9PEZI|nr:Sodium/hydrogen exchanger family-domain-containing protein [Neohortaea acidophila]KAF2480325.1 Sodium/hydrogen exchanger family-domain-containing protein [Neohortaea acidophila]
MMDDRAAIPYREPGIVSILILSSFLLLLNIINHLFNRLVYCGLVGQILIGVAWGTPGADWLTRDFEDAVTSLGYLGLILIVYHGGLSTNLRALKSNLYLSAAVALLGIACPIALSFLLQPLLNATPLQAFAAGAALCSTSLGTTFTVLAASGLSDTRLGVVLSSAAMMDDVVGLIMVQVISNLGGSSSDLNAITIVRPVLVSIAFAVIIPLVCLYVAKPMLLRFRIRPAEGPGEAGRLRHLLSSRQALFMIQTVLLLASVTGATYAGTSNLFAAYIAGAVITWGGDLYSTRMKPAATTTTSKPAARTQGSTVAAGDTTPPATAKEQNEERTNDLSGTAVYTRYYSQVVDYVLQPMFFASIGFAIPIRDMFRGEVVWKGIVYAALMTVAKTVCGLCLLPRPSPSWTIGSALSKLLKSTLPARVRTCFISRKQPEQRREDATKSNASSPTAVQAATPPPKPKDAAASATTKPPNPVRPPRSLYPAAIIGCAMVSRGEIGFLISSIAAAKGVYGGSNTSDLFLVVNWAILICTLLGPLAVGVLVRRVRRLQETQTRLQTGRADALGDWGVVSKER